VTSSSLVARMEESAEFGRTASVASNPSAPSSPSKRRATFQEDDLEQLIPPKEEDARKRTSAVQEEPEDGSAGEEEEEEEMPMTRHQSTISSFLNMSGYYTCISKVPMPLRWNLENLEEASPAGICFEAGNVVRMRSFKYEAPYLWAEVLSGGFVCAGIGDTKRSAAGMLLEAYFVPFSLEEEDEVTEDSEAVEHALRKLERRATRTMTKAMDLSHLQITGEEAEESDLSDSSESEDEDLMSERILELFKRFDVNGDGTIEMDELSAVMKAIDAKKWTDSKLAQLMSIMDTDKSRSISYEEFVDWMCGSCRWRKERRQFFNELGVETAEMTEISVEVKRRGSVMISDAMKCWQT